jgi:hypothetical protein
LVKGAGVGWGSIFAIGAPKEAWATRSERTGKAWKRFELIDGKTGFYGVKSRIFPDCGSNRLTDLRPTAGSWAAPATPPLAIHPLGRRNLLKIPAIFDAAPLRAAAARGLEFAEKGVGLVAVLFQFLGGEEPAVRDARPERGVKAGEVGFNRTHGSMANEDEG